MCKFTSHCPCNQLSRDLFGLGLIYFDYMNYEHKHNQSRQFASPQSDEDQDWPEPEIEWETKGG